MTYQRSHNNWRQSHTWDPCLSGQIQLRMILQREENEGHTLRSRGCAELGTWELCPNSPTKTALGKAIAPQDGAEEMNELLASRKCPWHQLIFKG